MGRERKKSSLPGKMSIREACTYLGIHRRTLMRYVDAGRLSHELFGTFYVLNENEIKGFKLSQQEKQEAH